MRSTRLFGQLRSRGPLWEAPVHRSTPSESHGFVVAGTVALPTDASRSEPEGREEGGVGAPQSCSRQRSAKSAGECETYGLIPVAAGTHNVRFAFSGIGPSTQVDNAELDVVFIPFAM